MKKIKAFLENWYDNYKVKKLWKKIAKISSDNGLAEIRYNFIYKTGAVSFSAKQCKTEQEFINLLKDFIIFCERDKSEDEPWTDTAYLNKDKVREEQHLT